MYVKSTSFCRTGVRIWRKVCGKRTSVSISEGLQLLKAAKLTHTEGQSASSFAWGGLTDKQKVQAVEYLRSLFYSKWGKRTRGAAEAAFALSSVVTHGKKWCYEVMNALRITCDKKEWGNLMALLTE